MKKFLFIFFIPFLFASCKNRFEQIGAIPTSPAVRIFWNDTLHKSHVDSIKLSNINYRYFGIDLRLSDSDRYYTSLVYSFLQGSGKLVYRSDTLVGNLLPYDNYRCLLHYIPSSEGLSVMNFTVTDQLKNQSSAFLSLFTFKNLVPFSFLKVSPIKEVDPLEYLLDASASYDADRHFGGTIVQYIYQVEGQTIATSKSQIKHIFSVPGVYSVSIQTKDNDGGFSPIVLQQISIN